MGDTWVGAALVKVESVLIDQNEVGYHLTFEKRRRCFRRREEQHAKRRCDGGGHGGVVGLQISTGGVTSSSTMGQVECTLFNKLERLIIYATKSRVSAL